MTDHLMLHHKTICKISRLCDVLSLDRVDRQEN